MAKVRPKPAKFLFISSYLALISPIHCTLHPAPRPRTCPSPVTPPGCRKATARGVPSNRKGEVGGRCGRNPWDASPNVPAGGERSSFALVLQNPFSRLLSWWRPELV